LFGYEIGTQQHNLRRRRFRTKEPCYVGAQAEAFAGSVFVDIAFVSAAGFLPTDGTFESSLATFRVKQAVVQKARQVALLVDHSKFGRRALSKGFVLSQINQVITDAELAREDLAALRGEGIKVSIADTPEKRTQMEH
jgi:DeoR/GlpR family transcriptional regulator of sugar metabolism